MTTGWEAQPDGTVRLHRDLRGQSLAEVLAVASECVDAVIERSLDEFELIVRDHGATDEALEGTLRHQHVDVLRMRRELLAGLRKDLVD